MLTSSVWLIVPYIVYNPVIPSLHRELIQFSFIISAILSFIPLLDLQQQHFATAICWHNLRLRLSCVDTMYDQKITVKFRELWRNGSKKLYLVYKIKCPWPFEMFIHLVSLSWAEHKFNCSITGLRKGGKMSKSKNIEAVKKMILDNHRITIREVADNLG